MLLQLDIYWWFYVHAENLSNPFFLVDEDIPLVFDLTTLIPWEHAWPRNICALGKFGGCQTHDVGSKPMPHALFQRTSMTMMTMMEMMESLVGTNRKSNAFSQTLTLLQLTLIVLISMRWLELQLWYEKHLDSSSMK